MCYEEKIKEVQPNLLGYVKSRVTCKHDAEDIVQDTNIILINKQSQYDETKNFTAWALTIAQWQIKAYFKKIKRCREVPYISQDQPETLRSVNDFRPICHNHCQSNTVNSVASASHNSPVGILEGKEKKSKIEDGIKKSKSFLNKREREIFELASLDYKNKRIAQILMIPESSVGATKYRAINKIKKNVGTIQI
jgi:RNA polymerase sigma factor (sigma-70 family)